MKIFLFKFGFPLLGGSLSNLGRHKGGASSFATIFHNNFLIIHRLLQVRKLINWMKRLQDDVGMF